LRGLVLTSGLFTVDRTRIVLRPARETEDPASPPASSRSGNAGLSCSQTRQRARLRGQASATQRRRARSKGQAAASSDRPRTACSKVVPEPRTSGRGDLNTEPETSSGDAALAEAVNPRARCSPGSFSPWRLQTDSLRSTSPWPTTARWSQSQRRETGSVPG